MTLLDRQFMTDSKTHVGLYISMYKSLFMTLLDSKNHLNGVRLSRKDGKSGTLTDFCSIKSSKILIKNVLLNEQV